MPEVEVIRGGLQTTIQDLGRPGFEHLGISPSGAADPLSLRLGNLLLGNSEDAAALEMTLSGPSLRFLGRATIALAGAEMAATLDGQACAHGQPIKVEAGQILELAQVRRGCRAYLAIAGGWPAPLTLGSCSTHCESRIGGFFGRGLRKGDRLPLPPGPVSDVRLSCPRLDEVAPWIFRSTFRVTPGAHSHLFSHADRQRFLNSEFTVTDRCNRLGLRLEGVALEGVPEVASMGVSNGSVQISSNGQATLLFVEQQLTGGYPQIATIIAADLAALGQLRPRDRIHFAAIDREQALEELRALAQLFPADFFQKERLLP